MFGVEENLPEGVRQMGTLSNITWQIFTNAGVFKSGWGSFGLIDEIGEFTDNPTLIDCFMETVDCFREGSDWIGMPVLAGTTDTKNTKNIEFMKMWFNHDVFGLDKVFISGDYYYGKEYFNMSTGKSDREAAKKAILNKRKEYDKMTDKTPLLKFRQNNPLDENDMFLIMGSTGLNLQRINNQIKKSNETVEGKYFGERGNIMWIKNKKGNGEIFWTADWVKNVEGRWFKCFEPINHLYPDADITAVDDFFKDNAPYSESLGGIITWRRKVQNANIISRVPVLTYLYRPPTLNEFHEDCLLQAVYTKSRVAVEYHNDIMKKHFLEHDKADGKRFLKVFPRVFNKVVNASDAFGYTFGTNEDMTAMGYAAKWVDSPDLENCYDLTFLEQIARMGTENADLGSAWKIVLLYEADLNTVAVKSIEEIEVQEKQIPLLAMGEYGIPVPHRNTQRKTYEMIQRHRKQQKWMETINR